MKQPDWLVWAWRELGVREIAGSKDNPRIRALFKDAGHSEIVRDEVAWCAAFVGACLERSKLKSTRSLMARSYMTWGTELTAAKSGAIAVLSRGSDPSLGHVGFVVGETDDHLQLLGGNQGQRVSVQSFPKSRLLELRWPTGADSDADARDLPTKAEVRDQTVEPSAEGGLFDISLTHVLEMEGGFSDDPYDPGGPTNKGITIAVYAKWIGETVTDANRTRLVQRLKRIPDAMVSEIYRTRYWLPAGCGEMPAALALMHFDTAVNHGVATAIRMLQRTVGTDVDGEVGPETRKAVAAMPLRNLLLGYADRRRQRYRELDHFWRFGRGWLRRVDVTLTAAAALIGRSFPEESSGRDGRRTEPESNGDQQMTDAVSKDMVAAPKWWGQSVTIWGVIVTGLSTVLPVIGPLLGLEVTGEMVKLAGEQVVQVMQALGGLIGTLMAIYGRVRATAPIERRAVSLRL